MISSRGATKGELKKDFQVAKYMIEALENDDGFDRLYNGFPKVPDNACIWFAVWSSTTSSGVIYGDMKLVQG